MMKVVVVDAQGGGLGAAIVKKLIEKCGSGIRVTAVGTNVTATNAMRKSGAHEYATGENAVCFNARSADVIIGGLGIIAASGMLGEITPRMARTIAQSPAKKVLVPISKCNFVIPGAADMPAKDLVELAADTVAAML
jgi:NAD(P)-dependent dehydrogenase (short-subunit alcohol dehydrogenase family)